MPFMLPPVTVNQGLHRVSQDLFRTGWGEYLSAVVGQTIDESPTFGGITPLLQTMEDPSLLNFENPFVQPEPKRTRRLTEGEWKASGFYRPGLKFPGGVDADVADLMAKTFDDRERRKDVLNRSPDSWTKYPAYFATALAASLLDPLNVASAFVPVVSQARAAGLAAKFGKIGGRFITGAIEGGAGAAMVEPLVYAGQRVKQNQDYTMADSLVNIAFGSVFGGGLHAGTGGIGDLLDRLSPHAREQLLRTAVAHIAEGKAVQVEPIATIAEALELRPKALPEVGDLIEFERGYPAQATQGEVVALEPHPMKPGEILPVVEINGNRRRVYEWEDSGKVVRPMTTGAEEGFKETSKQMIADVVPEAYGRFDAIKQVGISTDSIRADYGAEGVRQIQQKFPGVVRKGGMALDEVAGDYGFESADDLFQALVSYKPRYRAMAELSDRALFERAFSSLENEPYLEEGRMVSARADEEYRSRPFERGRDDLDAMEMDLEDYMSQVEDMRARALIDEGHLQHYEDARRFRQERDAIAEAIENSAECFILKGFV